MTAWLRLLKGPASLVGLLRARVWHCVVRRGEKREYANSNMPPSPQSVPRSCSQSHCDRSCAAYQTCISRSGSWSRVIYSSTDVWLLEMTKLCHHIVALSAVCCWSCNITLILSEPLAVSVCRLFRVNTKHSNLSLVQISVNQISCRKCGWTELWSYRLRLQELAAGMF